MTIRVKFTAIPGKHFLIRREAYKRITAALEKQGIFYAHRKVIVDVAHHVTPDMPAEAQTAGKGGEKSQASDPNPDAGPVAGAGAALDTILREEKGKK